MAYHGNANFGAKAIEATATATPGTGQIQPVLPEREGQAGASRASRASSQTGEGP